MRQRGRAALIVSATISFFSCQAITYPSVPPELVPVQQAVSRLVEPDIVRVDLQDGRYMRIGIINSPLRDLPVAEKQDRAVEIARRAYTSYQSKSTLEVVDVAFNIQGTRLFFLPYLDGRDSFRFQAADLVPPVEPLTERWVPRAVPERDLYFIAIGDVPTDLMSELLVHFRNRFGVAIAVLPGLAFDQVTYDPLRSQVIADELIAAVRFRYPTLARSARTRVLGITPDDMYMRAMDTASPFTFSLRSSENRFAVVSYARMDPSNFGARGSDELLRSRLRKMVAQNIGIMYYGLVASSDPRSVLHDNVGRVEDLDGMSELFDPR